jgi:DNA-binding phage protein
MKPLRSWRNGDIRGTCACALACDLETGKAVLRDYINATVGFERLAREIGTPSKSLMRMLGPNGNPRASDLLAVLGNLQRISGVHLGVAAHINL